VKLTQIGYCSAENLYNVCVYSSHLPRIISILNKLALLIMSATIWCYLTWA